MDEDENIRWDWLQRNENLQNQVIHQISDICWAITCAFCVGGIRTIRTGVRTVLAPQDLIDNCFNHFSEGAHRDVNGNITFDEFNCCGGILHEANYIFWGHRRLEPPPRDISAPRVCINHYVILRSFDDQAIPLTEDVAFSHLTNGGLMMGSVLATNEFREYEGGIIQQQGNPDLDIAHSITIVGMDKSIGCFKIQNSDLLWGDKEEGISIGWIDYHLVFDILQPIFLYELPRVPYRWRDTRPRSVRQARDRNGPGWGSRVGLGGTVQRVAQQGSGRGQSSGQGRMGRRHEGREDEKTSSLLRIAICNISYIRGPFSENYFNDKSVPALEMKIKKLMPLDAESRRLIDWLEKGVYDALQKKYLKTLLFCVCETLDGPMIEEYAFSFSHSNSESQEVSMNVNRLGNQRQGGTFKCNSSTEITPNQMRSSACKIVCTLIQLMRTLEKMPEERTILMKLLYNDDVTPMDYEPPFLRGCTEAEVNNPWTKNPVKMKVGNVNSKHLVLALKVKSVLDPCEDENDDMQDDDVSLGADSVEGDASDSETETIDEDQYVVTPLDKETSGEKEAFTCYERAQKNQSTIKDDDTQDPTEDEAQFRQVKDWISSYHLGTVELTDVLSNFSDISAILTFYLLNVLIEEVMDKLVKDDTLTKNGTSTYVINKLKNSDYEFEAVKEKSGGLRNGNKFQSNTNEDHIYMKALYYALPMNYVTVSKLHDKLEGEVNQTTVSKLIDKMAKEAFVEAQSSRRLGKRVFHSDLTEKKLHEVKKILNLDEMELDEPQRKLNQSEAQTIGSKQRDFSPCGGVRSIGSDLTRMIGKSDAYQNGSIRSDYAVIKTKEHGTPTSRTQICLPAASRESFAQKLENGRINVKGDNCGEFDAVMCSKSSSQSKRFRKASAVKEPILQYTKRQKTQVA